jgi:hypothetical protein
MIIGIIVFADDILLLANTLKELQEMLKICEDFGKEFQLKWNPTKTVMMMWTSCVSHYGIRCQES